jgi:predicted NUDIX family phosphoesterase
MSRDILVVKREDLFGEGEFQGFCSSDAKDYSGVILEKFEYWERNEELENNGELKQIIPYVWLINPKTKKVFLYKRSKSGNEGRLFDKYSGGVGGHIDRDSEGNAENPIITAMMRELKEEVEIVHYPVPKFVGFLNDDSDKVGRVHFGVVALAETEEEVKPAMDMDSGQFYTLEEIESIMLNPENELENWSKLSWPFVKDYVKSLAN